MGLYSRRRSQTFDCAHRKAPSMEEALSVMVAVATDYDGTLAHHGKVDAPTIAALERLKASGRKLLMVTGRELSSLKASLTASTCLT